MTANAYAFYRWLLRGYAEETSEEEKERHPWVPGLATRFQLTKGEPNPNSPRVQIKYPDSQRKDRHAGARGEIPVMMINVNVMKNQTDLVLDRLEPGGRVNFPNWLHINFFKELTVEYKDEKGKWQNPNKFRNESWDLLTYGLSGLLHPAIGFEVINWNRPPSWVAEWDENDLVFNPAVDEKPIEAPRQRFDFDKLAADLA